MAPIGSEPPCFLAGEVPWSLVYICLDSCDLGKYKWIFLHFMKQKKIMHWGLLFPFPPVQYIKILGCYDIQQDWWRVKGRQASRPEELQGSRGLLLASYIPDLELKVPVTQKTWAPKKKISARSSWVRGPGKLTALARWEMFRQLLLYSNQTPQKKMSPYLYPCQQRLNESLGSFPY